MKYKSFLTLLKQQRNYHVQAQKDSKEIVKTVHVTSVVQL